MKAQDSIYGQRGTYRGRPVMVTVAESWPKVYDGEYTEGPSRYGYDRHTTVMLIGTCPSEYVDIERAEFIPESAS